TRIGASQSGNDFIFRLSTDTIRQFIAFDGSSFSSPEFIGKVATQDLHGISQVDYIIVSHPVFMADAERLAQFHRDQNNLTVVVVTPEQVYNEFSSGVQDVSAVRDFMKMLYDRSEPGKEPKYLLLFGDASYDFKDRITNNTNFVPSYESIESLDPVTSFVTDDYFGLLDDNEGQGSSGDLDLGMGRLPVASAEESKAAVDKIVHYISDSEVVKNDWRNVVCFVADDQDEGGNQFVNDSETLSGIIENGYKDFNSDKIYLDAYQQVSTPGGNRYPDVNVAINKRVEKGALIMNYVGHGGEVGWAHERVLEVPDIKSWTNYDNMPVFMTATCEFSRFDDPERVSAGELVFLNPKGGGVALFTTTRLTYAGENKTLSVNFYNNAFKKVDGEYHRMGDLIVLSKYNAGASNARKFALLGDPALEMAYPHLNVVTTGINGEVPTSVPDTMKALATVTISGEIRDEADMKVTSFNGTIFTTVFDKASEIYTRANDQIAPPVKFYLRKNVVYKGKAEVVNGSFSCTFIVPKDIAYNFGKGKISYYARSSDTDANGYDNNIIVGGYDNSVIPDDNGPEVSLYMNNTSFVSGGITNQNPKLLAYISDDSGVNTVGNGIGHDITAILDNRTSEPIILNDYYVSDLNTFKSGVITFPFTNLADGPHHIDVKVWDVFNNSTLAGIDFIVVSSAENVLEHLYTYPNPMTDHTTFSFEINQVNQYADAEIRIYALTGNLVKTIRETIFLGGYRNDLIRWDGTSEEGYRINSGVYGYKLRLTLPDGSVLQNASKLVVIR
ncbi:MAG: type IX secretion system sortase PorU, partial [bacterium]